MIAPVLVNKLLRDMGKLINTKPQQMNNIKMWCIFPKLCYVNIQMKKMGLTPEKPTYTALFNACANCLDKQEGWKRAEKLRGELVQKNITPNLVTYKAMIKVRNRTGLISVA